MNKGTRFPIFSQIISLICAPKSFNCQKGILQAAFIKKLNSAGFSKEDLEEIGVDESFLKENATKLLSKKVIDNTKPLTSS